jgi:hypothetical protein
MPTFRFVQSKNSVTNAYCPNVSPDINDDSRRFMTGYARKFFRISPGQEQCIGSANTGRPDLNEASPRFGTAHVNRIDDQRRTRTHRKSGLAAHDTLCRRQRSLPASKPRLRSLLGPHPPCGVGGPRRLLRPRHDPSHLRDGGQRRWCVDPAAGDTGRHRQGAPRSSSQSSRRRAALSRC